MSDFKGTAGLLRTAVRCGLAALGLLAIWGDAIAQDPPRTGVARDALPITPAGSKRAERRTTAGFPVAQTLGALALTVAGAAVTLRLIAKFLPSTRRAAQPGLVHVLSQHSLGTRGEILVVRCGPRVLIVGSTATQLTTLAELADPQEIDELVHATAHRPEPARPRTANTPAPSAAQRELHGQINGMFDRFDTWKSETESERYANP